MNQQYYDEISLKDLISIVLKRKKMILIFLLISSFLSGIYVTLPVFNDSREYEAVSSISLIYNYKTPDNPEEISEGYIYYQDRLHGIMIPTINGYARSLSILRSIITELDLKDKRGNFIKAKDLAEMITIENQTGSNLILITAKYKEEEKAADIANKIPEKLIQMTKANSELSDYNIRIIDYAVASEVKKDSSKLKNVIIGTLLGLALGVVLSFFLNYFSKKIQLPSDVYSLGMDIDLIFKKQLNDENFKKIIALAKISDANSILFVANQTLVDSIKVDIGKVDSKEKLQVETISYTNNEFLVTAKEADLVFIIVEEDVTDIKNMEEIAKLSNKYNINTSVIYIEK